MPSACLSRAVPVHLGGSGIVVDVLWSANGSGPTLAFLGAGCVDVRVHLSADPKDIQFWDAQFLKLCHDGFCVCTGRYIPDEPD